MSLNPRQQRFVAAIVSGEPAAKAYVTAGYSPKAAETCGPRLLRNAQVAEEVDRRLKVAADRADISRERILTELARVGYVDPADVLDWDGERLTLRSFSELSADARAAISQVRVTKQSFTVRFHDKIRALELLGKASGVFKDGVELPGAIEVKLAFDPRGGPAAE